MSDEHPKPKTVKVEAVQHHTSFGKSYEPGDTYEIDEAFLATVIIQGKAVLAGETKPAAKGKK
jgi:hypothetical protein